MGFLAAGASTVADDDDLGPCIVRIVPSADGNNCIADLLDADPDQPGLQVDCPYVDDPTLSASVYPCSATVGRPCWIAIEDQAACPGENSRLIEIVLADGTRALPYRAECWGPPCADD